jgi:hypothetical protein
VKPQWFCAGFAERPNTFIQNHQIVTQAVPINSLFFHPRTIYIYNHLELRKNQGNRKERKEGKEGRRKKKKKPQLITEFFLYNYMKKKPSSPDFERLNLSHNNS